jgi:hypothetical protein
VSQQAVDDETTERYDRLMRLADLFDAAGSEMRARAGLGERVLRDPAVAESAELAPVTWARVDDETRAATSGRHGLLARSVELDADALVVRATVLTYRWIDDLRATALRTLGSVAARAVGYLAPEVTLGGGVVAAGLIETDALDRDGVAAFLDELAAQHPELLEHAVTVGGLVDGLRMRSLLATPVLAGDRAPSAARAGMSALGEGSFVVDLGAALRDVAGDQVERPDDDVPPEDTYGGRPAGLEDLMIRLFAVTRSVAVHRVAPGAYVAFLPGPHGRSGKPLRLVGGDHLPYAERVTRSLESAIRRAGDDDARVMLVGHAQGGPTALDIAAMAESPLFDVDRIVTAGAPSALVPRVPRTTRMLSLEDRADPVALLGSLVNAASDNRLTVVFDGTGARTAAERYVAGARLADASNHPDLVREIDDLRGLGYLS